MHKDPICGMEFNHENFIFEFKGEMFHFCSQGCLEKFKTSPSQHSVKHFYDLIIIGGGPAGLSAAVYASVSKIDTFLITDDIGGQAIDTSKIKNYMGFEFISGPELIRKFKELLVYDEKTLSEIAWEMGYSSVAHLSGQFKKITGFSPSYFKKIKEQKRKSLNDV